MKSCGHEYKIFCLLNLDIAQKLQKSFKDIKLSNYRQVKLQSICCLCISVHIDILTSFDTHEVTRWREKNEEEKWARCEETKHEFECIMTKEFREKTKSRTSSTRVIRESISVGIQFFRQQAVKIKITYVIWFKSSVQ